MSEKVLVDLTYPVRDDMLVYPGQERPAFSWRGRDNSEGYNLTRFSMIAHTGTHADSPLHFLAGGKAIDAVSLHSFYGETRLFRLQQQPQGQCIEIGDILEREDEIEEGSIFLLDTGIGRLSETEDFNRLYPVPSTGLVQLLVKRKIRAYMTDATSIDPVDSGDSKNHKAVLGAGIPIVENLANLDILPTNTAVTLIAFPLRLEGREGAPCRAVALY